MRIINPDGTKTTYHHRDPVGELHALEQLVGEYGLCECSHWAREGGFVMFSHHPNCEHANPERETYEILKALAEGIDEWASQEDGVYEKLWPAYKKACGMILRPIKESEAA